MDTGVATPEPEDEARVPRGDMDGLEDFLERLGRGADIGPDPTGASPIVLMSSGWNRPRLKEFFNLFDK